MKELRLDFSDYSSVEQEKDEFFKKKKETTDVYVMRVNGEWGAVMPRKRHNVIFSADTGVEITEFIENVKEELLKFGIKPRFRCVQNFGIESKIAENQIFRGKGRE